MPLPPYMSAGQVDSTRPSTDFSSIYDVEPEKPRREKPNLGVVLAVLLVLTGVGGGAYWSHSHNNRPVEPTLVAAPTLQEKAFCLDASGSVDQDGHLSRVGADALLDSLESLNGGKEVVPTYEPSAAAAPIHLQVRLVRADSYSTQNAGTSAKQYTVPGVSGLRTAKPLATDSTLTEWNEAFGIVSSEQQAARQAQADATKSIAQILKGRSDGSDITGCVAAALDAAPQGAATHVLLVSDLQDNALTTSTGDPRTFDGDYSEARLTIVQACPSGIPATCGETAAQFLDRMSALGIPQSNVEIVRPEQVQQAIDGWLTQP